MSDVLANPYAVPVHMAPVSERVPFLRKVALLTAGSLGIVSATAVASAGLILGLAVAGIALPWFLQLIIMLGGLYGAQFVGQRMATSENLGTRIVGFTVGSCMLGVALGFLLLTAVFISAGAFEGTLAPLVLPFQAIALCGLTVAGMVVYLLAGPRNLSMITGAVATLTLPMLALMALIIVFPVGGILGIAISAAFVLVSAGGMLVSLNRVMHHHSVDHPMPAAFTLSVGIVVL